MTNFNHLAMFRFARLCNDYPVESKITVIVTFCQIYMVNDEA